MDDKIFADETAELKIILKKESPAVIEYRGIYGQLTPIGRIQKSSDIETFRIYALTA